jgi:alanyl-tRNA synthetase
MLSKDIRQKFFDFFVKRDHEKVSSSALIPAQDPTLLFTNAGMNQFKDVFLGKEKRSYKRAVTIQKCMRAGGKHNDLDNVGFTKRHLTFFEMMGNFSFGDYFKKDAIKYAWDLLTESFGIPGNDLLITVYNDDEESYKIWNEVIGIPQDRIFRLGKKDNFWQMGDVGPCGPCTEIYIDLGIKNGCGKSDCGPGCNCDRFLEIWNLVFMQYDMQPDGSLVPLKNTGVDTGIGFERLAAVLQQKDSIFETDIFMPIIKKIEDLTGIKYEHSNKEIKAAFNVLADHIRAASLLLSDGCSPSNDGRGYVLRKIIRRAALFEKKLIDNSIFPDLVSVVVDQLAYVYPDLKTSENLIKNVLKSEINQFSINLVRGTNLLEKYIKENPDKKIIPGDQAFKLYDTYGFPVELIILVAQDYGFKIDLKGFESEMEKQREKSGKKMVKSKKDLELPKEINTKFVGYDVIENKSVLIGILDEHENLLDSVESGNTVWIITKETPFFVACGGQVNDSGYVEIEDARSDIQDLRKIDNAIAVKIDAPANLKIGQMVTSVVNKQTRLDTMNNHTATHLLQSALIDLLGKQVRQSGSIVTPDYLRFDFTYHKNLTIEEVKKIEEVVNAKIRENIPVSVEYTTYKDAVNKGVIAIFGEKYNPEDVRVIDVPGFSAELCGGTHVKRTGDIGVFKIIEVSALSAGNRRIFALTGPKALKLYQQLFNDMKTLSQEFKIKLEEVVQAVEKQKEEFRELNTKYNHLKKQIVQARIPDLISQVQNKEDIDYLFFETEDLDNSDLKQLIDNLMQQKPGFYFVLNKINGEVTFLCAIPKGYKEKIKLKSISADLRDKFNLRGGGSDLMIQGGGPHINILEIKKQVESSLK